MTPRRRRELRTGLLFVSPWIVGCLLFVLFPAGLAIYLSLHDYSVLTAPVFIGVGNYTDLASDEVFHRSLWNTLLFGAMALPLTTILALVLAVMISSAVGARRLFRTLIFLPSLVPTVAVAILWSWLYNDEYGLVNQSIEAALAFFGLSELGLARGPDWNGDPAAARLSLVLAVLWGVGQPMVIYLAGLQDIPRTYFEEAIVDGAGWWQQTTQVTLPLLSPLIYFNILMGCVGVLQVFALPFVMKGPQGPPLQSTLFPLMHMYDQAFLKLNMGYACAMACVLIMVVGGLTFLAHLIAYRRVTYDLT